MILFAFFGFLLLSFSSCNAVKYVADNEHLLIKNTITVNNKKNVDNEVSDYLIQRPNRLVAGMPIALHFYNWGNKDFLTDYEKWKDSFPGKEKFLTKTFSEKQARGFRNAKYNINQWFFKNGEAPVILDSTKTKLTAQNLQQHFINEGYFRTKIKFKENRKNNKRATVEYTISTGKIFHLDTISTNIKTPILDSIFETHKNKSLIQKGKIFKYSYFEEEADRITKLYRNSGIYHFSRNSIGFDADSTANSFKSNILLNIDDRIIEANDSIFRIPYAIKNVSKIEIYTDYSFNRKDEKYNTVLNRNGYTFYAHDSLKYNPKLLLNSVFIEPKSLYKDSNRDLTRKHLRGLQNFRLVDIQYQEIANDSLVAKIYLTPYKKYSFATNAELTHSNVKQLGVSGKISILNRNTFKGSEILRLSVQGSFFNTSRDAALKDDSFFNAWEFGGDISLEIPRILFPLNTDKFILKSMSPKTQFTLGTSYQKNIGLDKRKFTGIIDYNWQSSRTNKHKVELINAQYISNLNKESYFDIYSSEFNDLTAISEVIAETTTIPSNNYDIDGNLIPDNFIDFITNSTNGIQTSNPVEYNSVQNIQKRKNIITEDALVPVFSYEFTYNNSLNYKDNDFTFFRARIANSGGITSFLAKKSENSGKREIRGTPVAQYFKTDFEFKRFWGNSSDNALAFRSLIGIAIPYGNSDDIPFSRSYFIGGANDLRAWKIYDLGPGSIQNGLEYNVGSLKLLTSLEYRFKIINSVKGALFIDAGNIWDITNTDLTESEGKFHGFKSIKDIAVGSGFGVRYDFNFLVLRLDLGFKTYEPYLSNENKWFNNFNFGHAVWNIGINYPF
ncbi:hypothetical protein LPB138_13560 [Urechidicola croceus]|uniref:Bacterial surface antigen (D15) domain-containing protein n=1 Tax=Urechidicola croceus TaxID=1850246 RepID=A0A1D8PC34_9FLAO|nr:hypothetical protein LPB138_13560 [Urechidicola croceus]